MAVYHAVAGQVELLRRAVEHPAYEARVVGMACKPSNLSVSKHPAAWD